MLNPQSKDLTSVQNTDEARVKRLAQDYLKRRGQAAAVARYAEEERLRKEKTLQLPKAAATILPCKEQPILTPT